MIITKTCKIYLIIIVHNMNNSWIVNKQNRLVYDNDMNTFRNHLDNCVEQTK